MPMAVVHVGHVRMIVRERRVSVAMRVRLARGITRSVDVLMMFVVRVEMRVV
jgi:hypothetical protein